MGRFMELAHSVGARIGVARTIVASLGDAKTVEAYALIPKIVLVIQGAVNAPLRPGKRSACPPQVYIVAAVGKQHGGVAHPRELNGVGAVKTVGELFIGLHPDALKWR